MGIFDGMRISGSGLTVERKRLEIISENIANVNTPASADGGAYRARRLVSAPATRSFGEQLAGFRKMPGKGVKIRGFFEENKSPRLVYDPGHPDADPKGYVEYPDINILDEMVEAVSASRLYQANLTTFNESKKMFLNALDIGK